MRSPPVPVKANLSMVPIETLDRRGVGRSPWLSAGSDRTEAAAPADGPVGRASRASDSGGSGERGPRIEPAATRPRGRGERGTSGASGAAGARTEPGAGAGAGPQEESFTSMPMAGQISQTNTPRTIISRMLAGMPARKNSLVLNWPLR